MSSHSMGSHSRSSQLHIYTRYLCKGDLASMCVRRHVYMCACMHICSYIHAQLRTYKLTHTYLLTHTHTHTHTHIYMHAYIHTYMHAYMHTYIHAYIHAYMHTYIHIHKHTNTHTHTHTHIHPSIHPSIHTYIHTYKQTYIHTHIHTKIDNFCRFQRYALNGSAPEGMPSREENSRPGRVLTEADLMITHRKFALGKRRAKQVVKQVGQILKTLILVVFEAGCLNVTGQMS
jgi:hypothetical protein